MRLRCLFLFAPALLLGGCATLSAIPRSPSVVANKSVLDERALLGVELSYKAARTLMADAAGSGFVDAALAAKLAALDDHLFAAIQRARAAYGVANATSYTAALAEARPLLSEIWSLIAANRSAPHAA